MSLPQSIEVRVRAITWEAEGILGFELLLSGRRPGPAGGQGGLAGLEEVGLPPADRLLADLLAPSGLGDRQLTSEDAQDDPSLLLGRDHRGSTHVVDSPSGTDKTSLPEILTRDTLNQADFDAIADQLNGRPRQTLGFKTPSQALAEVLR